MYAVVDDPRLIELENQKKRSGCINRCGVLVSKTNFAAVLHTATILKD